MKIKDLLSLKVCIFTLVKVGSLKIYFTGLI